MKGVVVFVLRSNLNARKISLLNRILIYAILILFILPVTALSIVSDSNTYDANISVTFSPENPRVGDQMAININIKNTGTAGNNFIVGWGPQNITESQFSFTLAPGSTKTFTKAYIPKDAGNISFKFSIYRDSPPNNQLLQQITKTITVFSSSQSPTIITPTISNLPPTITQNVSMTSTPPSTVVPGTTPTQGGFELGIAAIAIIAVLFLKRTII